MGCCLEERKVRIDAVTRREKKRNPAERLPSLPRGFYRLAREKRFLAGDGQPAPLSVDKDLNHAGLPGERAAVQRPAGTPDTGNDGRILKEAYANIGGHKG